MEERIKARIEELTAERASALEKVKAEWERLAAKIETELLVTHIKPIDARLDELNALLKLADMELPAPETVP